MRTWHKIQFYKRLFLIFIALNVFVVCAGLVVGWDHWSSKVLWQEQQTQHLKQLEKILTAKNLIFTLLQEQKQSLGLKQRQEQVRFIRWKKQEQLQTLLRQLNVPQQDPNELRNIYARLSALQAQSYQKLTNISAQLHSITEQITWVAILTLIFGVLLPCGLFYLTGRALNYARKELQCQIHSWVEEWMRQAQLAGDEPFKNVAFWAKIALLVIEGAAQYSHHPMLDLSADISKLIRVEMTKSQSHTEKKAA